VIWYLPDSSDGWVFSFQLFNALHSAGWDCGWPTLIPESPQGIPWRDMPRAMVAGGQPSGVTVVGSDIEMKEPAFTTLFEALGKSLDFGVYGSGGSQALPVPAGTLRLVVAGKTDPMFRPLPAPGAAPNK